MTRHFEVHVTAPTREEAEAISVAVVSRRVAACAQVVGPVRSVYRWEGEVQQDEEFLILMKTGAGRLDDLVAVVRGLHSYTTPEVVAVPIEGGLADYLGWVTAETAERSPGG
ncbi:divalent-cation tolerance protein CutA [Sphaerisporangium rubeum]|uniref:Periplasmic divalent cation tolerance protein n=1 Tax=Sphaerisporangium rubeum TaxID=321317 RepID=A0A7X0M8L3_9ACTN|nr:divalent-cation tolerance protein CutA [Sphaerisporangium rubeum]MBB6475998.1 periplasmic divalent cation tolerance protein [Sphaerisporangium rubeum]